LQERKCLNRVETTSIVRHSALGMSSSISKEEDKTRVGAVPVSGDVDKEEKERQTLKEGLGDSLSTMTTHSTGPLLVPI
jgi:hypothetical protein